MKKDVNINIKSTTTVDGESDVTELFTFGKLSRGKTRNAYRLTYEESEATGFEGSSVFLDISDKIVTMTRKGTANSTLIIETDKKHHCHYGTPYGDFLIGIQTDSISNLLSDKGGVLYVKYTLDINSSLMSCNEMSITVTEQNRTENNEQA